MQLLRIVCCKPKYRVPVHHPLELSLHRWLERPTSEATALYDRRGSFWIASSTAQSEGANRILHSGYGMPPRFTWSVLASRRISSTCRWRDEARPYRKAMYRKLP